MSQATCEKVENKGVRIELGKDEIVRVNPRKISATTIIGDKVINKKGKQLGKVEEIVFDLVSGTVSYIVLSVGGFAGIGDRFFAIPLDSLTMNIKEKVFYLDMDEKKLKKAQGFDKFNWPDKAKLPLS